MTFLYTNIVLFVLPYTLDIICIYLVLNFSATNVSTKVLLICLHNCLPPKWLPFLITSTFEWVLWYYVEDQFKINFILIRNFLYLY